MHLYLDTTDGETIRLALGANGALIAQKTLSAKHRQSERLLAAVEALLAKAGKTKRALAGIVVTNGPGKFTATRIGVATANALAYALGIPAVGIAHDVYTDVPTWITAGERALGRKKKWNMSLAVEPRYGSEPNITLKR